MREERTRENSRGKYKKLVGFWYYGLIGILTTITIELISIKDKALSDDNKRKSEVEESC